MWWGEGHGGVRGVVGVRGEGRAVRGMVGRG